MVWPFLYAGKSPNMNIKYQRPLSGIKLLITNNDADLIITPFQEISVKLFIFVF